MNATFRSLHIRNFRLFFVGQLVSQTGNWLTLLAQTLLVLRLTDDGVAVGLLTACQFAPVLLLGPWAGLLADRSDKRRLLLIVQSWAMAQSFALAALALLDPPPLLAVYALAMAGGVATAFDHPARRSFVVEMVPEDHMQNAVSLNSALMTSARVVGPALAGLLVVTVGFSWAFALDGLSYTAVLIALARMDPTQLRASPVAERARGQIRAGLRYARSVPDLWIPLLMMALVGTLAFNFSVVVPLFVRRSLGGSETTFTLLFSVISVGSLAGALVAARRTTVTLRHVAAASGAFGVTLLLLAAAPTLAVAFGVSLLVGFSSIAFLTTATTIFQLRADPVMRGRVLALQAMVFLGSTPVGGPLLGAVCERFGPRAGLVVGAASALVASGIGVAAARRRPALQPA
ncbi:MAG: MFS transporter [Acidimicrobiales bacterium]